MDRRSFLKTASGLTGFMISPGRYSIASFPGDERSFRFEPYRRDRTMAPVMKVTPEDGFYIHTFFDVCPFSPSGRFLAVTRLPFQDHLQSYGDIAEICVIDLENQRIRTVYRTRAWDFQLGANLNWGKDDSRLYTNDIIGSDAVCVKIDLQSGEITAFSGPMYHLAPDESSVIGFPPDLINVTQKGYGVPRFRPLDKIEGAPGDQGLWKTILKDRKTHLLVSLEQAFREVSDKDYLRGGNCYFFHSKFNPQGTRIFQVMRCLFPDDPEKKGWNPMLLTLNSDGSGLTEALRRDLWSGNHPNWHSDGEHIIMNLRPKWKGESALRFCRFHHTGGEIEILSNKVLGSGHPRATPDMKYLVTDCYVHEPMANEKGEVPIRLVDLESEEEEPICHVFTDLDIEESVLRIDPHPAWSRDWKKVCFNGAPEGKRQVFIADLEGII